MTKRQPSSIDRQPPEIRELIGALRKQGRTIDEIMQKLGELSVDVSRSAVGRHVKGLAEVGERMRRSRDMAEALVARFGDEPDNRVARLNFELMHGLVFETLTAAAGSEEGEDGEPVTLGPQQVKFLTEALKNLASAQKADSERTMKVRAEMAREAAQAVDKVAKREGLSRPTIDMIKAEILGIAA
jgi:DNA-binding transcriptional ArsR family regulator